MAETIVVSPTQIHVLGKRQRADPEELGPLDGHSQDEQPRPPKSAKTSSSAPRAKKFACPHGGCDKKYVRPSRLEEHIRSTHTKERAFECEYEGCDKAFFRKSHLEQHTRQTHTKEFNYKCDFEGCQASFVTNQRLKAHRESHVKKLVCPYPECNQPFRKKRVLQSHIAREHENQKAKFQCPHVDTESGDRCTESFSTSAQVRRHEADAHGVMQYWCTVCIGVEGQDQAGQAGFKTYTELQQHNRNVHPPTCETCGTSFASPHLLENHFAIHHSGLPPEQRSSHQCPVEDCQKLFTRASNLRTHIRTVHEDDRSFVCGEFDTDASKGLCGWDKSNACYQGFGHKAALEKHIRVFHFDNGRMIYPGARAATAKAPRKRKSAKNVSVAAQVTGDGFDEESGRHIACVVQDCHFQFARNYDLEQHLQSEHWLDEEEVAEALAEYEALNGGKFWLGGLDGDFAEAQAQGTSDQLELGP